MPQAVVSGTLVSYTDTGKGPVLLCLHGWLHDSSSYKELGDELKDTHRVIALDLPNFGASETTEKIQTLGDYSNFIQEFLDKMSIKEYVLVGHSMGGQIAIYAAGNGILKPEKIILIASAGIRDHRKIVKTLMKIAVKPLKFITTDKMKARMYKLLGSDYNPKLPEIHKKLIRQMLQHDIQIYTSQVKVPVLLVYGSSDKQTPPWMGKKLAEQIPDSKYEELEGRNHWLHQIAPREVAESIKGFLKA